MGNERKKHRKEKKKPKKPKGHSLVGLDHR